MNLIDTHCHLCHGRLHQQVPGVLDRAREAGVHTMICAAADLHESRTALGLARRYDNVYCMAGVHPHEAQDAGCDFLAGVEQIAQDPQCVAVGEIGLDYHYDYSPRPVQQRVFAEQLDLARGLAARVVIHMREAFEDPLAVLRDSGVAGEHVVFHSCTELTENVRRVLDLGAMVSFSGIVTFKKTDSLRQAAAIVPDDRLLIETDAPFLSPEPVRRMKTNEPAHVAHVAACLAGARNTTPHQLADQTTANARRFFSLDAAGE